MTTTRPIRRSHYRLLGLVGHGQFGRVYCAVHRQTGELVAIKDLHRDRFPTHKFLRELRFLISLEHPNIVACHALEHSETGRQIILDYCEGGTLRTVIESDVPPTVQESLAFILDILAGLDYAHRQGIIHCDIKPENILLSPIPGGWKAKISDFGIARLSRESKTSENGQTGSPAYMAPERFYNQHSAASDIYAVGIILFELVVGHRPFSGTPTELMVAHLNQPLHIPETVPSVVQKIIEKALQKLLPRRFRSAAEMRSAVAEAYTAIQAEATPTVSRPSAIPAAKPANPLPLTYIPHSLHVMGIVPLWPDKSQAGSLEPPSTSTSLLIACFHEHVWFYHWPSHTQALAGPPKGFSLPSPITGFITIPAGGCLFTEFSIHLLSMTHGLGTIARCKTPMVSTISPDGKWFATCPSSPCPDNYIIRIQQLAITPGVPVKVLSPKLCTIPTTGICTGMAALDKHHLVIVFREGDKTELHVVNRRGVYLGKTTIQVSLLNLVPTSRPYRYLAIEADTQKSILIIDFKPFRVFRYRLPIKPSYVFDTAFGYGALSYCGQLALLSEDGHVVELLSQLPTPGCIAQITPTQVLIGTHCNERQAIATLDLTQIGVDIIF